MKRGWVWVGVGEAWVGLGGCGWVWVGVGERGGIVGVVMGWWA